YTRVEIASFFNSPDIADSLLYALPGLWFFSLNKVLMYALNGLRHMRFFAVAQSLRYLLMLGGYFVVSYLELPPSQLTLLLSIAEVILFPVVAGYFFSVSGTPSLIKLISSTKENLQFGTKGFFNSLL